SSSATPTPVRKSCAAASPICSSVRNWRERRTVPGPTSGPRMSDADPTEVALVVARTLDVLGVPYLVGGSLASTIHGMMRTTIDADLVADLEDRHVEPFARALEDSFYLDRDAIRDAVR